MIDGIFLVRIVSSVMLHRYLIIAHPKKIAYNWIEWDGNFCREISLLIHGDLENFDAAPIFFYYYWWMNGIDDYHGIDFT